MSTRMFHFEKRITNERGQDVRVQADVQHARHGGLEVALRLTTAKGERFLYLSDKEAEALAGVFGPAIDGLRAGR